MKTEKAGQPEAANGDPLLKDPDLQVLDAQTLIVMAALHKINDLLESKHIKATWHAGARLAKISFVAKSGIECEFRTRVELGKKPPEPLVFFGYDRGSLRGEDFSGTPASELSADKILEYFKKIFEQAI